MVRHQDRTLDQRKGTRKTQARNPDPGKETPKPHPDLRPSNPAPGYARTTKQSKLSGTIPTSRTSRMRIQSQERLQIRLRSGVPKKPSENDVVCGYSKEREVTKMMLDNKSEQKMMWYVAILKKER